MEDNIEPAEEPEGRRDHVSIEVRHDDTTLVSSIKKRMEDISTSSSISKVPENLVKDSEKPYYFPAKVSIGPFHHGKQSLKAMEDQKWRYLHSHLSRKPNNNLEKELDSCVKAIRESEHRARICYAQRIGMTSDEFVQMMLVDGCFLIELFLKYSFKSLRRRGDMIFGREGMLFDLRCDLVLLENQMPLLVVQRLFEMAAVPKQCQLTLTELAFRFFRNMLQGHGKAVLHDKFSQDGNHLLDLVYHSFLPTYAAQLPTKEAGSALNGLDCVSKLQQRGIKLKKGHTADSLLDMKFSDGILEIPPLKIHRYTESLLRNLIAYEQCYKESTHYVTSYALLMSKLIVSDKDSKLLSNVSSSSEEREAVGVSRMFQKLSVGATAKSFYYEALCERLNGYRRRNVWGDEVWKKLRGKMRTPIYSVVVLVVAIVLIVLTFVGTLFTVLSFSIHRT